MDTNLHDIEEYTTGIWSNRWKSDTRFKLTKEFYAAPNKLKSKGVLNMSSLTLSTWVKGITGHNNLAYFQSKLDKEISPVCRLCNEDTKTLSHLISKCEATEDYGEQNSPSGHEMVDKKNTEIHANIKGGGITKL